MRRGSIKAIPALTCKQFHDKIMLNFICEWIDRSVETIDAYESTFCRFYIKFNDDYLTRILCAGDEERNYIRIPVYSLAEWIVYNWWALLYEVESPFRARRNFIFRHSILSGSDGYTLPNIIFYPHIPNIKISCIENGKSLSSIVFVNINKEYFVTQEELKESFTQFVLKTIARLNEKGFTSTMLHQRWEAISALSSDELEYCKICGMLGVDPFDIEPSLSDRIIDSYEKIPSSAVVDFFSTTSAEDLYENSKIVDKFYKTATPRISISNLEKFRTKLRKTKRDHFSDKPWKIGYQDARSLRRYFDFKDVKLASPNVMMQMIGVEENKFFDICKTVDYERTKTVLSSYRTEDKNICFSIAKGALHQQTFYLARAIYSHLSSDAPCRMVTQSYTLDQQENRAFAAELIAPARLIHKEIGRAKFITSDDVERIAQDFNVSSWTIAHQIQNHIPIEMRQ